VAALAATSEASFATQQRTAVHEAEICSLSIHRINFHEAETAGQLEMSNRVVAGIVEGSRSIKER
jgi:hypothetical protein